MSPFMQYNSAFDRCYEALHQVHPDYKSGAYDRMEVILDQLRQHKDWLRAAKELDSLTNRIVRRIA